MREESIPDCNPFGKSEHRVIPPVFSVAERICIHFKFIITMANPANSADSTAKTNETVTSVEAIEVLDLPTPAQPVVSLPNGGVITGDDLDNISFQDIKQFPAKKRDGITPHTYANQDYYLFSYKGKNFTTRNKDFASNHSSGDLYSVTIGERVNGSATYFELVGYTTDTQHQRREQQRLRKATVDFQIKRLDSYDPKTAPVDADLMGSLLAGASAR